ncbi:hypothetical protein F1D05_21815 [Kribbella qitaiheensis]|uniref:HNH endonuclease n=1 Tax=Kribbella qitaiheensis TaxID=1544730 RepID=A0A7G6X1F2_9ACTN|nr:hypothetical protein [Kribbella qitaiheensis]QNE20067.1 hypothetical protein F1D05_21815 [Kribbella qitaiheensis]
MRAATGDVIRLNATITQIADALVALGDIDPLDQRRAKAIGIIADPALAHHLLEVAQHLATSAAVRNSTPAAATPGTPNDPINKPERDPRPEPVFAAWDCEAEAEADRDTPHPSTAGHPLDGGTLRGTVTPIPIRLPEAELAPGPSAEEAARRELVRKVAAIKDAADREGISSNCSRRRPARTVLYVHVTDQTLLRDYGFARVEGFGPALVRRLSELLGHDRVVIRPVIDLNDDTVSVDAYEIPDPIRERIKLEYPIEQFPYGTAKTGINTDLDHIEPYVKDGPPGQTSTKNLAPLGRLSHRIKTHGGWNVARLDSDTIEWITRYGFKLHVTHRGTHLVHND